MPQIRAILFDLGDTLLDFGAVDVLALFSDGAREAYDYLEKLGQPLPPFKKFLRVQLRAIRWRYLVSRVTGREFNSMQVLGNLSRAMGHTLTDPQVEELAWLWYGPLSRQATVESGLPELLDGFRSAGLQLAVVSNTFLPGVVLDRHMRDEGLLDYFPVRVYSCDVRYRKPHPRIFEIALSRIGATADQTVFVGDNLSADVGGAAKAGMTTVLKDPSGTRSHRRHRPDFRITALGDLPAVLARCAGRAPVAIA
jgi:putative hydrolase of the HAD superfamily